MIRFKKADPANDAHFKEDNPLVLVKPSEVPITPVYPENPEYWDEFDHALERGLKALERGRSTAGIAECFERTGIKTAYQAAQSVRADWPSDLMQIAAKEVVGKFGFRDLGMPEGFTNSIVLLDALIGLAGLYTSPSSFCYKDKMKVPRLEEVALAIALGEIDCPARSAMMLKQHPRYDKIANDPTQFTLFPGVGCPNHASCGAMHSAAAAAEGYVINVMTNTEGKDITNLCTLNVGDFRIDALVHTKQDNDIGFWIGQETAKRWLRGFLLARGADAAKLDAAMDEAETKWI